MNEKFPNKFQEINKVFYLKFLLIIIFTFISLNSNAQIIGRTNDGFHVVSTQGEILTEAYDFIQNEGSSIFLASQNGKFGYLNTNGSIAIPLIYDVAYPFIGDFALVGVDGKYYHINKANKVLDSLDWPQAPLVYHEHLLLVNEGENKVLYTDGTELLKSRHQFILAPKGGIILWNAQKDTLFQYVSPSGTKELKLINIFSAIDTPRVTNQGYLCVPQFFEGKKTYAVYDELGDLYVRCDMDGVDPNLIHVVWNNFVYVPDGTHYLKAHILGSESHFSMTDLWLKGRDQQSPMIFQLSNKYKEEKMSLLKDSDKWIRFERGSVKGNYLFDEVLPGDQFLTPAKMGQKWFLYNHLQDSLIALPYNDIHPIGMDNGRFFASSQTGSIYEARWSFVSYKTNIITEDLYKVPLLPVDNPVYDQKERYHWNNQFLEVIKDEKRTVINNSGKVIWVDSLAPAIAIEDFFKVNFKFRFDNFKELPKGHKYKKNQVFLSLYSVNSGIYVQLINTKKTTEPVDIQDGYLQTILEMKKADGTWVNIGSLDPSWCGNSYYGAYFPKQKMASTTVKLPEGNTIITVRVVLNEHSENRIVSNELQVKTSKGRQWVDKYYGGYGCTTKN